MISKVFLLLMIIIATSCDKSFTSKEFSIESRLKLTRTELYNIREHKNLDYFKLVQTNNLYNPLLSLKSNDQNKNDKVSKFDSKKAFLSMFNKDNVFEFDEFIVFLDNSYKESDNLVLKMIKTIDYDNFIQQNPLNKLSIPDRIVVSAYTVYGSRKSSVPKNSISKIAKECVNCDDKIDKWACGICLMAGVATFAGCGAGLIELAACISCYYSLKEYHACKEEQSAPHE